MQLKTAVSGYAQHERMGYSLALPFALSPLLLNQTSVIVLSWAKPPASIPP